MATWQLIKHGKSFGQYNMDFDRQLFAGFEAGLIPPTLRFYGWSQICASYGYGQKKEMVGSFKGEVAQRPTGGGIVYHRPGEVTYSLVAAIDDPIFPRGLVDSYKKISQAIIVGLSNLGIKAELGPKRGQKKQSEKLCFAMAWPYEIMFKGQKIVGSAQKRGRKTLLQQGTILIDQVDSQLQFAQTVDALIYGFKKELGIRIDAG